MIIMETAMKSTSTLHYVTSSDVATQTAAEGGEAHGGSSHTDTSDCESDSSDEEELEEPTGSGDRDADERTRRKSLVLSEDEPNPNDDEAEARRPTTRHRPVSSAAEDQGRSRAEEGLGGETEVTLPAAVNNVQIIQNQHVTNNNYLKGSVQFDWSDVSEQIITEKITAAQQITETRLKSMERTQKKDLRRCKEITKEFTRQLLQNQANDAALKEQLIRDIADQREEMNRKQKALAELQQQTLDQVAKLAADQEEARRKEKEEKSFVLKLGEKHKRVLERVWTGLEQSRLVQLMKRLYRQFRVKLEEVSVHCGMQFVVAVPPENVEQQAAIQEVILEEILPEDFQTEVEWEPAVPLLGEAELNPPVQVSEGQEEGSANGSDDDQQLSPTKPGPLLTFDPMTTVPKRSFEVQTSRTEDANCCVTSLLITGSRLLVLADNANMKVMCTPLDSSHADPAISTRLTVYPWDLAVYQDDVIAVATDTNVIFLLKVATDAISTSAQVETERAYRSVTSFGDGDLLVVGSVMDSYGPAVVDVITGEGRVLWTVLDDRTLPDLECPSCLHLCNRQVLVADIDGPIHRVDVTSGETYPALTHPDLKDPWQVTADARGNTMFAIGYETDRVLVLSLTSDQWRPLLTAREHGEGEYVRPRAVGVTEAGVMVVSWGHPVSGKTVVIAYDLNSS